MYSIYKDQYNLVNFSLLNINFLIFLDNDTMKIRVPTLFLLYTQYSDHKMPKNTATCKFN